MVRLPPALRPLFPYVRPAYVRAVGAVSPVTRALSRRRGDLLPTGFVDTLDEAAARTGGRCVVARPAETVTRPPLLGLPEGMPLTDTRKAESFGRVAVAELPGARVLGQHRAVIAADGSLVDEVTHYFDTTHGRQHPLFLNPYPQPPLEIPGRLGVLAVRGDWMYYHFLTDVLSRIGVLEQAPDIAPPDRWYVAAGEGWQRELLGLMGIDADRIVDASEHPHVRAECLVVPGWPADTQENPPWVPGFLRSRLLPAAGVAPDVVPHRRLYVTRGAAANNRAVRNEDAVIATLQARGFETFDPAALPVAEQIRTWAEASLVVASHGGALGNMIFMSPGSRLIELFPSGTLLPDYWRVSAGVPGLTYRYLSSRQNVPRLRQTRQTTIVRDLEVDLRGLERLVDEAGTP